MIRSAPSIFVSVFVAMLTLAACSERPGPLSIDEADPGMAAAIAAARSSLPEFWQVFDSPANGESDFSVKVEVSDSNGVEHFWVTDLERRSDGVFGTIANDPEIVSVVTLGERIEIPDEDISDWLYFRGGKMYGNHTIVPFLDTMPPEEAQMYRELMADS